MMTAVDLSLCATLLRAMTDNILATPVPKQGGIGDLIGHVRSLSPRSAKAMRDRLANHYPDISWVDEQTASESESSEAWIYDPIDGAYHYLQGLPLWSSSLVLLRQGKPVVALVYDATRSELFTAVERGGSHLNGSPITVAAKTDLDGAVVGTAVAPILQIGPDLHAKALALFGAAARSVFVVRQMASASLQLAYVAAGRLDGYWEAGDDIPDWLAGTLLAREAGGLVTDLSGEAFSTRATGIIAAPPSLHSALLKTLRLDVSLA